MKKNVWIIFFNLLFCLFYGCQSTRNHIIINNQEWPIPSAPEFKSVEFIPVEEIDKPIDGYYIKGKDAGNLINNVEELKAYVKKLELLIFEMQKYYSDISDDKNK